MKAWITYSYSDKDFVERLKNSLQTTDIEFQEIEHEILPGDNIVDTIYKRISQSEIIFVILSKEGVERKWFSTELGILISEIRNKPEKRIFPILKDKDVVIPPFIDQYQFVDLSDKKTFDKSIDQLQKALSRPKERNIDLFERELQQKNIIQSKHELLEREKENYEKKKKEKQKIFVESDEDEILQIKFLKYLARYNKEIINLTIAPTLDCNFNCEYCFEENRIQEYMNDETENAIIEYINTIGENKDVRITWYGGEPLLDKKRIYSISRKVQEKHNLLSSIITNGYLLDKEFIDDLKNLNIISIQITIDGSEDTHNRRRPHKNGKSYNVIMSNLEYLYNTPQN